MACRHTSTQRSFCFLFWMHDVPYPASRPVGVEGVSILMVGLQFDSMDSLGCIGSSVLDISFRERYLYQYNRQRQPA